MDMRSPVTEMRCSRDRACGALWDVHAQLKPMLATIIEGSGGVRVALKISSKTNFLLRDSTLSWRCVWDVRSPSSPGVNIGAVNFKRVENEAVVWT